MKKLKWRCCGDGKWQAESKTHDEGVPFEWVVFVTRDGEFTTHQSPVELSGGTVPRPFGTLYAAKEWCESEESE